MTARLWPVDCDSGAPLPKTYVPGYFDKRVVYKGGARPGWSWFQYGALAALYKDPSGESGMCCGLCWVVR